MRVCVCMYVCMLVAARARPGWSHALLDVFDADFVFVAFALYRTAAILQGVYARALQGNASNANALQVGKRAGRIAERGWAVARRFD